MPQPTSATNETLSDVDEGYDEGGSDPCDKVSSTLTSAPKERKKCIIHRSKSCSQNESDAQGEQAGNDLKW